MKPSLSSSSSLIGKLTAACEIRSAIRNDVVDYLNSLPDGALGSDGLSQSQYSDLVQNLYVPVLEDYDEEKLSYQQIIDFLKPKKEQIFTEVIWSVLSSHSLVTHLIFFLIFDSLIFIGNAAATRN